MKKTILTFILAWFVCFTSYAQEVNIQSTNESLITIVDSLSNKLNILSTKLNLLQHNYDFLESKYSINYLLSGLKEQSNNVSISSESLLTNVYHVPYNYSLYAAHFKKYKSSVELLKSTEQLAKTLTNNVLIKIAQLNFNEQEIIILKNGINAIEKATKSVQAALDEYKIVIEMYYSIGQY